MSRICCTSWFSAEASWNCWSAAARRSSASSRWSRMVAAARSVCTWIPYLAVGHMCPSVRRCLSRRVTRGDEHEPKGSNVQLGEGRNRTRSARIPLIVALSSRKCMFRSPIHVRRMFSAGHSGTLFTLLERKFGRWESSQWGLCRCRSWFRIMTFSIQL